MVDYIRYFLALLVVLGLIGLLSVGLRKYGMRLGDFLSRSSLNRKQQPSPDRPLYIKQTLGLDPRRRIVLVNCNGVDHVLYLGPNNDFEIGANGSAPGASLPSASMPGNAKKDHAQDFSRFVTPHQTTAD